MFQQGAGLVDAHEAVYGTVVGCANRGMNVTRDLNGGEHYHGPANMDADGDYGIMNGDGIGFTGDEGTLWSGGFSWSNGFSGATVFVE